MRWKTAYNETRKLWMVWHDGTLPIAYCYVQSDAEKITRLLNAEGVI